MIRLVVTDMNTIKIDVTKILKEHLYQGQKGKYLDLILWENKDGPDQYGNTHTVVQSVSKQARESGVKGPILGNAKIESGPSVTAAPQPTSNSPATEDDVPF